MPQYLEVAPVTVILIKFVTENDSWSPVPRPPNMHLIIVMNTPSCFILLHCHNSAWRMVKENFKSLKSMLVAMPTLSNGRKRPHIEKPLWSFLDSAYDISKGEANIDMIPPYTSRTDSHSDSKLSNCIGGKSIEWDDIGSIRRRPRESQSHFKWQGQ